MSISLLPLESLPTTLEGWLHVLGRAHVLLVHFPIALIWMAALAAVLHRLRSREGRSPTALACLGAAAGSAVLAGAAGWLYADLEPLGSSVQETLFRHRWLGVAGASSAVLAFAFSLFAQRGSLSARLYGGLLALAVVLLSAGAHFGGVLVYGPGYLFGGSSPSAESSAPEPPTGADEPGEPAAAGPPSANLTLYEQQIRPLFEKHCVECHGPRRQKAKLRLDDLTAHFERYRAEWVIEPGDAEGSQLYQRVVLPPEHEDVMPAKGAHLTDEEVTLLRRWIDGGAEWSPPSDGVGTAGTK